MEGGFLLRYREGLLQVVLARNEKLEMAGLIAKAFCAILTLHSGWTLFPPRNPQRNPADIETNYCRFNL